MTPDVEPSGPEVEHRGGEEDVAGEDAAIERDDESRGELEQFGQEDADDRAHEQGAIADEGVDLRLDAVCDHEMEGRQEVSGGGGDEGGEPAAVSLPVAVVIEAKAIADWTAQFTACDPHVSNPE